jgi:hypothetical protein
VVAMSDKPPRKDWANDPRVLAEFCTCPKEAYWLTSVPEELWGTIDVIDLNCPVHGSHAQKAPF